MKNTFFSGLSSLLLPFGLYGASATAGSSYQRSYLGSSISASTNQLPRNSTALPRDLIDLSGDELDIQTAHPVRELVIVDGAVSQADKSVLRRALKPGVQLVELDSSAAGLPQLINALDGHKNLAAIHVVSHAEAGVILLGNSRITPETIQQEVYAFAALKGAVREGGDLLFYGCDLAANKAGEELLDIISNKTGLDLAASNNLTGNSELQGDWDLEVTRGNVESTLAFSEKALSDFSGVLFTGTINFSQTKNAGDYYGNATVNAEVWATGTSGYFLTIDGLTRATELYTGLGSTGQAAFTLNTENSVTLRFNGNAPFSPQSLRVANIAGGGGTTHSFTFTSNKGSFSQNVVNGTPATVDLTSFGANVTYITISSTLVYAWMDNFSVVGVGITVDETAPVFQNATPSVGSQTLTGATLSADLDEDGTVYYVVVADGASAPSVTQVRNGQNSSGAAALASGNFTTTSTTGSEAFSGLSAGTNYDLYVVAQDDEGSPNVQASATLVNFTTQGTDSDATLTAAGGVSEPIGLATTIDTVGEAVSLFDFTITDGGTSDGLATTVSQIVVNVSGTSTDAERGKITWRLNGPDASNVTGTYSAGADTITFSGLSLSVANSGNETYTVNAYYNDNTTLIEDRTIILSVDGDTNLTVGGSGTQMASGQSAVTNGSGTTIDVVVSQLVFTTQPAGSVSGAALTTQPVVRARDAFGNTDVDFTETITFTEASAGTLTNGTQAATAGVATFTNLTYTATADQQAFTLTANDQDGVGSNLPTVDANSVTSDVVATQLVFATQPAPTSVVSGQSTSFTTVPVVSARDANSVVDTGYSTGITLAEVNGAGSATMTGTGDTDGNGATVSITPTSGVSTFTGMQITYTNSGAGSETFNLRASSGGLTTADSSQLTAATTPTVTDGNISISGASGTGGAFKIGDTVTATWNNTAGGDNNAGITGVTVDFSQFGGGAAVVASNSSDTWTATYTIVSGAINAATNRNVSVTATNASGDSTTADTTNATVDNVAPNAPTSLNLTAGSDTGSSTTDDLTSDTTPTITGSAEGNSTVRLYDTDGTTVLATTTANGFGNWLTTSSALADGVHSLTAKATDAAGNEAVASTALMVTIDTTAPTVTDANISIAGGSGTSGAYIVGDTVTATWNNTAGGDNNSDTINTVTVDFSQFGGGAAVVATNSSDTWTATYTILAGAIDTTNRNVSVTATDNAGNTRTQADSSNATVDNIAPAVSSVTVPANATYVAGQNLDFSVNTNGNITVNTGGGTPRIALTLGASTVYASYLSGSGSSALTFRYTVQAGDADSDGIALAASIDTNGGTLQDGSGNTLVTTLNSVGSTASVLVDAVAPTVSSVSVPSNATYIAGQNLDFTVNTNENITVNTGGGTPQIALTIGATTRQATYLSGSGTSAVVFRYTVQVGDQDSDGVAVAANIVANGGTLRDAAANDINTTLNSVGSTASVLVDAVAPTVSSVSVPANATYITGQNLDFTVNTDENITVNTGGGTPQIALTIGATTRQATYLSGSGTSAVVFRYTVQAGESDTDGIVVGALSVNGGTLRDSAGNDLNITLNSVGSTASVLVDAVAPTISSVSVPANATYIAGQNLDFTVNTNENITVNTGGGTPQIALTIGATTRQATYLSGSGTSAVVFRYTVQAGDSDTDGIAVGALSANGGTLRDSAGNDINTTLNSVGSTASVLVDAVAPTVSSVSVPSNATYVAGQNLDFTVNTNENITVNTGGGIPRIALTLGASTVYASYLSGSGSSALTFRYTVQAGESDTDGIVVGALSANGGTLRDSAGNDLNITLNSVGSTASVLVDAVAPNAPSTPNLDALSDSGSSSTDNITSDTTPTLTGTAEVDSTVTLYDTDGSTVLGTATATGGNWSITSTALSEGSHSLRATTTDTATNISVASSVLNITIDITAPAKPAILDLATASDTGASDTDNITNLVNLTLQGAAGSVEADASVHARSDVEGGLTNTTANPDGSWSLGVTGLGAGTHQLTIRATDVAGNVSNYSDPLSVVIDTSVPALTGVAFDQTNVTNANQTAVSTTLAGAETGTKAAYSIASNNGGTAVTASALDVSSASQQFSGINVTGLNDGTLTVSVTLSDLAGNTSATRTNTISKDTTLPSATIVVTTTALIEGDASAVTITFNEAVTGFTNADLTIENATLSAVSSGDGGITWTATLTAAVGVNDSTNVITLANTGVADAAGNAGSGTTTSNNYTVNMANSSPILSGFNGGSTYIENGTAVVIDADASVSDADFDLLNSGNGNYSGASLVIARSGGAVSSDIIGFTNGNGINQIGNSLIKNGLSIASVNSSVQGQWTISFTDANTEIPTRNDAVAVLRQLTYSSSNEDPATSVNLGLVLSDGIVTAPGVAAVTITPVNDAPTLTATASSPTFTEGGSAVNLFSGLAVSTVEAGQLITELQLTVTNLVNAADEIISIDGSNLALTNGNSATTTTNAMTANVSVSGSTATLVLTKPAGISAAAAQTLVNGISYRNTSEAVTNSSRTVTLTRVVDDGGTANSGVDTATISVASTVTVTAVNDGPAISGTPATSVNQDVAYAFVPTASDLDGDTLVFSILNQPTWASFNTATGALTGTPVNADVGVTNGIVISVSDGTTLVSLPAFNLTVVNVNDAPVISGTPTITVDEDSAYSFTPTANDVDASTTLVYSITNQPSWASFSTTTGSLTGTPTNVDVGVTNSIVISVSDGTVSASLSAFNLTVSNTNDAPVISGTPATSIDQDVAYSFVPVASDVDVGTTLTYSITNQPTWASFNTATGALTGTPVYANAGVYSGIVISVSDGQLSAALPAFSITVIQGQNPDEPILTAPADLTLNATALYTPVSVRQLLGLAANSTQAQVDAALNALASNVSGNNCCTTSPQGLNANNALLLAPGRHEVRWVASNTDGLTDEAIQVINLKPLVNFSKPQIAVRNSQVEFRILLNGPSPVYPFEVAYQIDNSTTAGNNEHNLVAGIAQFTVDNPLEAVIPVTINPLTGIGNRELVVAFADSQANAGAANRHNISIREGNLPPVVKLVLTQGGIETSQITPNGGAVTVTAQVSDFNATDTHSFDWSATRGLVDSDGNSTNANRVFTPTGLTGVHQALVTVTDSGGASAQADLSFKVVASLPVLTVGDTDGDGTSDLDEGADDSDSNGIPDYLDNMPSSNVLPQVGLITDAYLIECDPGVRCGLGLFALTGNSGGVQILDDEVATLGSLIKDDKFVPAGGIFDFVIRDLPTPGQTVRVVIPQQAPIPANAVYRKFQKGQWINFVEDADNSLYSAAGNPGYCPPPGAVDWQPGLTAGHLCVQLGIEDGGPNDDDGLVNAAVSDPGAVSAPEAVIEIKTKGKGGGSVNGLFLLILAAILFLPMRKLKTGLLLVMTLAGISSNTQALDWESVKDKTFIRFDIYEAQPKAKQSYLQADIDAAGFDAQVTAFEVDKTAYAFSAGYQWSPLTYTQIGYLDLGDVKVNLILDAAEDMAAFSRALEDSYPITANGITLVQGLSMYPHPKVHLSTEAGVFIWDGKINVAGNQLNLDYNNQTDLLFGFRLDYELISQISLGVSLQHLAFDKQGLDLFGVSARYEF